MMKKKRGIGKEGEERRIRDRKGRLK